MLHKIELKNCVAKLLAVLMFNVGCGGPDGRHHTNQPSLRGADDRHVDKSDSPRASDVGAANSSLTQSSVDNSAPAEERVIESALDSLELRMAVRAEKDPQKRAALEKQLQRVKIARQSIYARE